MKNYQKKKKLAEESKDFNSANHGMLLPSDIEAEQNIIGTLIAVSNQIITIAPLLKSSDFYSEVYSVIYDCITCIFQRGENVDSLSVIRELKKTGQLEFIGGSKKIAILGNSFDLNPSKTALWIIELSRKRQLIQLMQKISYQSFNHNSDVFDLISETQSGIIELLDFKFAKNTNFEVIAKETYNKIISKSYGELEGIPSKFRNNNELTGGYRRGTLRTVAARPGIGKSTHLVNEAAHMAHLGYNVMIFSLEMPAQEVTKRLISISTQIETWKLDKNQLSESEHLVLQKFVVNTENSTIYIDDSSGVDFLYIASQIKKIKMKNEMLDKTKSGMDIVFIDYIQIMKISNENRNIGIGDITRSLKTLSKDLNLCVVIFSQLNRSVESRGGDKRPLLSDLKESGSIEEDSDVVEFLYRAEKYGITEDERGESTVGIMEIITEKNRQGANGTTKVKFIPSISTLLENNVTLFSPNNIEDFENQIPKQMEVSF